jgi:integrating conjugative element protein (TIGR03757 family)
MTECLGCASPAAAENVRVEAFTTAERPMRGVPAGAVVYEVDGIARLEAELSDGLPAEPEAAKALALARFDALDAARVAGLQQTARGLVRAAEYGLDRVPAVVFDEIAVVCSVTDLDAALRYYRRGREATDR